MSENAGHLGKNFLRVAKRIVTRMKGKYAPPLELIFCAGGTATATDGAVLIQADTGSNAVGYINPKQLSATKDAEYFAMGDGLSVHQGEALFPYRAENVDGEFPNIRFPELTSGYYDVVMINPALLIDALDVFEKKGGGARVSLHLPTTSDGAIILIGQTPDGKDARAMVMPLRVPARPEASIR
jgi:hypothetical protein